MITVISLFWMFLVSSFLGFIVETLWCIIRYRKIEWRKSLIYEPLIPIYGVAGLIIFLICSSLKIKDNISIFLIGFVISTIVEYIFSVLQEKVFGTTSWNYDKFPLNLNGRVNFLYSVLFGFVAVALYNWFLLPVSRFFNSLSLNKIVIIIFTFTVIFFLYDVFVSLIASFRMKERRNNIKRDGKFWNYIDKKYNDDFLKKIYPNITVIH